MVSLPTSGRRWYWHSSAVTCPHLEWTLVDALQKALHACKQRGVDVLLKVIDVLQRDIGDWWVWPGAVYWVVEWVELWCVS